MRKLVVRLYSYDELSDEAKAKARQEYNDLLDFEDLEDTENQIMYVAGLAGFVDAELSYRFICEGVTNAMIQGFWSGKNADPLSLGGYDLLNEDMPRLRTALSEAMAVDAEIKARTVVAKDGTRMKIKMPAAVTAWKTAKTGKALEAFFAAFNTWANGKLNAHLTYLKTDEVCIGRIKTANAEFFNDGTEYIMEDGGWFAEKAELEGKRHAQG